MSEGGDYTPQNWGSGTNFSQRTTSHRSHMAKSYTEAKQRGIKRFDRLPERIVVPSWVEVLCYIINDYTGSMGDRAQVMVGKLLYADHMRGDLLGQNGAIGVASVTDANGNTPGEYPLQMRVPERGAQIEARMKELIWKSHEGGGTGEENYELAALYLLRNVEASHVGKRIAIFFCDEKPYDVITREMARNYARVNIDTSRISTESVFQQLSNHWSIYALRVPYYRENSRQPTDQEIERCWVDLLGRSQVTGQLVEAQRVMDVVYGIWAKEMGLIPDFLREILYRQTERDSSHNPIRVEWEKIDPVIDALRPLDPEFAKIRDYASDSGETVSGSSSDADKVEPIV